MKEEVQKLTEKVTKEPKLQNLLNHRILQDNVLLLPIEFEGADTVLQAKQYEDKPEWGLVVSVGEGRLLENGERAKIDIDKGDVVLFMSYGGTKQRSLGQDFIYVRQEDIISVYNE